MQGYRNLSARQKAHELGLSVYKATTRFPADERFGLTSQLRRSAVSITANVAEGSGHRTTRDFAHFLDSAKGSAYETECLTTLARDLGYLDSAEATAIHRVVAEVRSMLVGLSRAVRAADR